MNSQTVKHVHDLVKALCHISHGSLQFGYDPFGGTGALGKPWRTGKALSERREIYFDAWNKDRKL